MPGIVGLISYKQEKKLFNLMLDKIHHQNYQVEKYIEDGVHIGKIHHGYLNNTLKQKIYDRYYISMTGEIFNYKGTESENIENDARFFLDIFIKKGLKGLSDINGQFTVVIYDFNEKKLYLISDRYGTKPKYYTQYNNSFIFSPEIKSILSCGVEKELNWQSISELLHFGHLFGNHSLFRNIYLLPPASCLIYQNGTYEIKSYWQYPYNEKAYKYIKLSKKQTESLSEELQHLIIQAIKRQTFKNSDELLFSLSGGMDSRFIIGGISQFQQNLTTFTMGDLNSEEQIWAEKVASFLNLNHHKFTIKADKIIEAAKDFAYISESMSMLKGSLPIYHPLQYFYQKKQVILSAQMGDAYFGSTLQRRPIKKLYNKKNQDKESAYIIKNIFNIFPNSILKKIFQPWFFYKINNLYEKVPMRYIEEYKNPLDCYFNILMNEHGRRGTLGGNIVNNIFYEMRMPSYDNDLLEFGYQLPLNLRMNKFLYRKAFCDLFPDLAKIPRENTNLPISSSEFLINLKNLELKGINVLKKTSLKNLIDFVPRWSKPKLVNYKKVFDEASITFFNEVLLSEKAKNRKVYNEKAIQNLIYKQFYTNENVLPILWQLINLEYFFLNFIDDN